MAVWSPGSALASSGPSRVTPEPLPELPENPLLMPAPGLDMPMPLPPASMATAVSSLLSTADCPPIDRPPPVSAREIIEPLAPGPVSARPMGPPVSLGPRSTWSPPRPPSRMLSIWSALNISSGPSRNSRSLPSRTSCLISSPLMPSASSASASL